MTSDIIVYSLLLIFSSFFFFIGPAWLYYNIFNLQFILKTKKEKTGWTIVQIILAFALTLYTPGMFLFIDGIDNDKWILKAPLILTLFWMWLLFSDRGQRIWKAFRSNPMINLIKKEMSALFKGVGILSGGILEILSRILGILIFLAIAGFVLFFLYKFIMFFIMVKL